MRKLLVLAAVTACAAGCRHVTLDRARLGRVKRVAVVIRSRDVTAAMAVGKDDEEMDQLRRQSFTSRDTKPQTRAVERAFALLKL